jgi:hypothetical protein
MMNIVGHPTGPLKEHPLMRAATVLLALSVLLSSLTPAFAWNAKGHMTVALLAYRKLTDRQKAEIDQLLRAHPHYKTLLADEVPTGVNEAEWAFMRAAVWPDLVRPDKERQKPEDVTKYHNGPWHYINVPYIPESERARLGESTFRPNPVNVIVALRECQNVLESKTATPEEKAIHLAWLLHLVGDVHQPMHCVALVTHRFPEGDRGGNDVGVRDRDKVERLHGFWDDVVGIDAYYPGVTKLAERISALPASSPGKPGNFEGWVDEGHDLAIKYGYLDGKLEYVRYDDYDSGKMAKEEVPQLPKFYFPQSRDLAQQRIGLAADRLARQISAAIPAK